MPHESTLIADNLCKGDIEENLLIQNRNGDDTKRINEQCSDESSDLFDEFQRNFEKTMHSFEWRCCPLCKERFFARPKSKIRCLHSKNICPNYSDANMDPGVVPPALLGLSYIEEQLIARAHPIISVFKLKGRQYGYKGNVVTFPQNIKTFAKTLPHKITDLSSVITVRTSNGADHVDFIGRAAKVHDALTWLQKNNPHYYDIEICEENLQSLPENGNIYDQISNEIPLDDNDVDNDALSGEEDVEADDGEIIASESCVPMIGKASEEAQLQGVFGWPEIGKDCINEFNTPGYIAQAFPCLFPSGKADLRSIREKKVTPLKYFQHLFRYEDERFEKHPRFRYFALNSVMRWTALTDGNVFVQKNASFKTLTVSGLKEEIEQNPALIKQIMFSSSSIRGTRAYWFARGKELLAMVEQLGLPTLFFTLSAADLHWPDLFKFLVPDEDPAEISSARRRKLVQDNPNKVDMFFMERCETFINEVLRKKFDIKDYWFRVEYQHRGSLHIHDLLWLNKAPDVTDISGASEEKLLEIITFYDTLVSTMHPAINTPPAPVHPSRRSLSEIEDVEQDVAELINRVQRHTKCTDGYCLRKSRTTGKKECRFKYPIALEPITRIVISDKGEAELVTARNDEYINRHNRYILQTWRANVDISPVLSKQALINYLAKYVSKPETQSKNLNDVLKSLMNKTNPDKSAKNVIQRLYIQCCSERDYSAQEACHILMGRKLYSSGGRKFVILNFKKRGIGEWLPVQDEDGSCRLKGFIQKYQERSEELERYSLWYTAQKFVLPSETRHRKDAIVQVFPRYSLKGDTADNEEYYRQGVLLHVPWRSEDTFISQFGSWKDAYDRYQDEIDHAHQLFCNITNIVPSPTEYEDASDNEESLDLQEWMVISKMGPNQNAERVELGKREIDVNNDWHKASRYYDEYGGIVSIRSFLTQKKATCVSNTQLTSMPPVEFTTEQKAILSLVELQIDSLQNKSTATNFKLPTTMIVQGKAGTGKSLVIRAMTSIIQHALGQRACLLLGPTGVSALNIGGSTLHSKIHLSTKTKEFVPLKGAARHEFCESFKDIYFIIIDEYSMIGCKFLHMIERRLSEAKDKESSPFGALFIYMFGDINQLGPVGDIPAYSFNQNSPEQISGKLIFTSIDATAFLTVIKRQDNIQFQNVLNNVSAGTISINDYNLLKTRFTTSVCRDDMLSFDNAIHLFPKRKEVENFNKESLMKLRNPVTRKPMPVARVPATHNCAGAAIASANEAEGLKPVLYLAEHAKIMLRANLWTERGLINGAVCRILHILYEEDCNPPDDPPALLICSFDSYMGPFLNDNEKSIPIERITKTGANASGQTCSRSNFPISLSYACSTHKSQGLTLEKVFVDVGTKEMAPGLTYTGLFRAKSLDGLLLQSFPPFRLLNLNKKDYIQKRNQWEEHLLKKSNFCC